MFDVFKTAEFKRALTFYVQEVKNNRKHFLISMSSAVLWCFLVVLHPYLIKRIVDDGIVASNRQIIVVFISFLIVIGYIRAASIGISCLLYTSPSPRDLSTSRMPSSA